MRKVYVAISSFVAVAGLAVVVWCRLMVAKRNPLRGAFSPHFLYPPSMALATDGLTDIDHVFIGLIGVGRISIVVQYTFV